MLQFLKNLRYNFPSIFYRIKVIKTKFISYVYWVSKRVELKKIILHYYRDDELSKLDAEKLEIITYLKTHKLKLISYKFSKEYHSKNVILFFDKPKEMYYVIHQNKRLYYRKDWSKNKIKKYHTSLLIEQDQRSPHCYLSSQFNFEENSIFVDAGTSEGIFSLSVIENAKKGYLFEPDDKWNEPLSATFEPWKHKIEIINKVLSNCNLNNCVSLDNYFKSYKFDFIKIDVEGNELELLSGCKNILTNGYINKITIATYHKQEDELLIRDLLESSGYNISFSNGFILFYFDSDIKPPYLRRGIIRATRN